jgi:hypothetical protein
VHGQNHFAITCESWAQVHDLLCAQKETRMRGACRNIRTQCSRPLIVDPILTGQNSYLGDLSAHVPSTCTTMHAVGPNKYTVCKRAGRAACRGTPHANWL